MFSLTRDEFDALAPLLWHPARRPAERRQRSRTQGAPQRLDHFRLIHQPDSRVFPAVTAGRSRRVGGVRPFN